MEMNKIIKQFIENETKEISAAGTYEAFKGKYGYVRGIIMGLYLADGITKEEKKEFEELIEHHSDIYWKRLKTDCASVHSRLYPAK